MNWAELQSYNVLQYYYVLFFKKKWDFKINVIGIVVQFPYSWYVGDWSSVRVLPWTMEARSRYFRWMRGKRRSGIRFTVRRIKKKEQLEENELCYVAWGACFCDNISTLRDGMRCTESKLAFCWQLKRTVIHKALTSSPAERHARSSGEKLATNSVCKSWYSTIVRFSPNILTTVDSKRVISRKLECRHWFRHTSDAQ